MPWAISSLAFLLCGACLLSAAELPQVIDVWPGKPPDENTEIGPERTRLSRKLDRKQVEVTEQTRLITDVSKPTLTVYPAQRGKDPGTAMIICPGGG